MKAKYTYIIILLVTASIFSISFSVKEKPDFSRYKVVSTNWNYRVPNFNFKNKKLKANKSLLYLGKSYLGFKEAIGFKESQGNYLTINPYGYLGKYQFGKGTLEMIGIKHPKKEFLSNSMLQEKAFLAYASKNKWILRRDIKRYVGKYIDGIKITESGILAAAHLAGAGNVKKYLRSGGAIGFKDAFGTSIRYYLKKFAGYDTTEIPALKKPMVL